MSPSSISTDNLAAGEVITLSSPPIPREQLDRRYVHLMENQIIWNGQLTIAENLIYLRKLLMWLSHSFHFGAAIRTCNFIVFFSAVHAIVLQTLIITTHRRLEWTKHIFYTAPCASIVFRYRPHSKVSK
jgi:hypothetical protein